MSPKGAPTISGGNAMIGRTRLLLLALLGLVLGGCGGAAPAATPSNPSRPGEVVVFAAASLSDAFGEIAQAFQQAHPGAKVIFHFAGSSTLRTQLAQGARADVFASADEENMRAAQQAGVIEGEPAPFARNTPVIVVPADNPAGLHSLKDLARPGVRLVLAAKEVPIGRYARQILERAGRDPDYGADFADRVLANRVSEELNVKAALAKVALGEADATFVYRTDVTADVRGKVQVIEIPAAYNVIAEYSIAVVRNAPNPEGARAFVAFVRSPAGQEILARWGFQPIR